MKLHARPDAGATGLNQTANLIYCASIIFRSADSGSIRSGLFVPGREVLPLPVSAPGGMKVDLLQKAVVHNAHDIAMPSGIR